MTPLPSSPGGCHHSGVGVRCWWFLPVAWCDDLRRGVVVCCAAVVSYTVNYKG
nr:MAG TPA: hypothetical protein [Bacteriophage sp.]